MGIMDTSESIGSLEEQAHKRKERLRNLKRKTPGGDNSETAIEIIVPLPKPKFRSYKPQDETLKEAKLEDAEPAAVEDEVKDLLEAGKEKNRSLRLKKDEVMLLINLVENNPIVYTRTTNIASYRLKDAAWEKIANEFNSTVNSHPRKPEQLRLKWQNLKQTARKRYTAVTKISHVKSQFGIPDHVQPDEVLDRVAALLGANYDGIAEMSLDETNDLNPMVVIQSPNDGDETEPIDCVEVGVGEACTSSVADVFNTTKEPTTDLRKKSNANRTSGKSDHQNLIATEVESRIHRNNAIAEYYTAKKKKVDEEILLNRAMLLLQKKKVELELLELEDKKGSKIDKEKLLIEKKEVQLEILEVKRKKYSNAASLFRAASESL